MMDATVRKSRKLLLLAFALGGLVPSAIAQEKATEQDAGAGLLAAVAEVWTRSRGLVWEGPRVAVGESSPPPARLRATSREAVVFVTEEARARDVDLQAARDALSLARFSFAKRGWEPPLREPFELYVVHDGDSSEPHAKVRSIESRRGVDRANVFATLDAGLLAFDAEACSVDAYARAVLLAFDPAEDLTWRRATSQALTQELLGRTCTDPFVRTNEAPLSDSATLEVVQAVTSFRELWELGQQSTWEGSGVRASPNLWEVLAYVVQGKQPNRSAEDVWRQFLERLLLSRTLNADPAVHPPFAGKTRRIWGDQEGLEPLGVEGFRFSAEPGSLFQIWLHGEPGTRWLLYAEARDAAGRVLTGAMATSKNRIESGADVVVYHPVEALPGTREVVIYVGNMGGEVQALATPDLQRRSFHLVIGRQR